MGSRANYDNIKDHGYDNRTASERRELAIIGGKASGEARRKKANFRKTLNAILTTKVKADEWEKLLSESALECTPESIMNMVVVQKAIDGDLGAYRTILGVIKTKEELESKTNEIEKQKMEIERQKVEIEKQRLEIEKMRLQIHGNETEECESDGFMEALKAFASESVSVGVDFIET